MAKGEIIDQLVILAEAFGLSVSDARMGIYADMLSDLPIDKIRAGIIHNIKTRTFAGNLPTVAEIREAAAGGGTPLETRATLAWDLFLDSIHSVGPYQSVEFEDPIIRRIIIAWGGWTEAGDWPDEETKWKRKEFIQLYQIYARDTRLPEPQKVLIGLAEAHNRDHFPEFVPEPIQISGEERKQKRIATG